MTSSGAESWHRLVLDTSAYSHFRHGHSAVLDHLAKAETILLPVTVLGELEAAFELSLRAKENRLALAEFLDEPCPAEELDTPYARGKTGPRGPGFHQELELVTLWD